MEAQELGRVQARLWIFTLVNGRKIKAMPQTLHLNSTLQMTNKSLSPPFLTQEGQICRGSICE